jgi:EmrB/QacA subfamily drug resistance transporter
MRVLLLAAGATFLAMLDATVANLAIPDLRADFPSASVADVSWVITAYAVTFAALLTPAGRLAGTLGPRRLFLIGVGLFTVMSLVCAAAPGLELLTGARALQGVGAAAMIPASLAVLLLAAPPERRAGAIGLWSAASALAAAAGPSIGGVLVDGFGWRAVFVINLPMGAALAAGIWRLWSADGAPVPSAAAPARAPFPDPLGTVLLVLGIGAVVLGLTEGGTWGWGDPRMLAALIGGALAVAVALRRSTRHPAPAVETGLWRSRGFALANVASLLYGLALYPWLLVGVLLLTQVWGYSELEAGLAVSPGALTAALAAVAAGRLAPRVGVGAVVAVGAATMAATGLWTALTLPAEPDFVGWWLPVGAVLGLGMGAVAAGTATAAALSVPPARFAAATGLNTTARQLGGALGVAALAVILPAAGGLDGFVGVYVFCTLASAAALVAGLGLVLVSAPRFARAPTPILEGTA